jgi:hypothetical protein
MYALTRFAGAEGLSSRFDDLLVGGAAALPPPAARAYGGLADWSGVAGLKQSLRELAGTHPDSPCLLAGRSAQLMRLAARLLFLRCRRVLVSDLEWPDFLRLLEAEGARAGGALETVPLRAAVFRQGLPAGSLCSLIADHYCARACDGIFLSAVTFEGARLPVAEACAALDRIRPPRFVVIDGSQAFCHTPIPAPGSFDLLLAGCHKWLGAFNPLAVGFGGRRRSWGFIGTTAADMEGDGTLDDPLFTLVRGVEGGAPGLFSETVGLSCLFTARAAAVDLREKSDGEEQFCTLAENTGVVAEATRGTAWKPLLVDSSVRSGIALLQAERAESGNAAPAAVRQRFLESGVVVTTYAEGVVRVSVPRGAWRPGEIDIVRRALRRCA